MSNNTARASVVGIFIIAFVINCGFLMAAESVHAINWANFTTILFKLAIVYSVPAGALIGGIFVKRPSRSKLQPVPYWVAIAVCCIWNLLLVWGCLQFEVAALSPTASGGLNDLLNYFETVSKAAAFVTGAITFFLRNRVEAFNGFRRDNWSLVHC